jgi:cytidylate kinase
MIVSLSGAVGSGKSTIAQMLSLRLSWPRYYMGGMRREAARAKGMTLAEFNKWGEKNHESDTIVDEYQKELGKTQDNFIIEGRTSWYFIPHSFKIYLDVSREEGAKRVWKNIRENPEKRNEDQTIKSLEDMEKSMETRRQSDDARYKKYYDIDVNDKSHYDYVLDTSSLTKDEVADKLYDLIMANIDKK